MDGLFAHLARSSKGTARLRPRPASRKRATEHGKDPRRHSRPLYVGARGTAKAQSRWPGASTMRSHRENGFSRLLSYPGGRICGRKRRLAMRGWHTVRHPLTTAPRLPKPRQYGGNRRCRCISLACPISSQSCRPISDVRYLFAPRCSLYGVGQAPIEASAGVASRSCLGQHG